MVIKLFFRFFKRQTSSTNLSTKQAVEMTTIDKEKHAMNWKKRKTHRIMVKKCRFAFGEQCDYFRYLGPTVQHTTTGG